MQIILRAVRKNADAISDLNLIRLVEREAFTGLEIICLYKCRNISDDGLFNLAMLCPSLQEIDIRGYGSTILHCSYFHHSPVRNLSLWSRCAVSGAGITRMCAQTPELRALWASGCDAMTDAGVARAMLLCSVPYPPIAPSRRPPRHLVYLAAPVLKCPPTHPLHHHGALLAILFISRRQF
jgi:hypothetical protein